MAHVSSCTEQADIFVGLTHRNNLPGVVGVAWIGTACLKEWPYFRVSMSEFYHNELRTAYVSYAILILLNPILTMGLVEAINEYISFRCL